MCRVAKCTVFVAVALMISGPSRILAGSGSEPEDDGAKLSSSIGTDRSLTRSGAASDKVKISRNGRRIIIADGRGISSGYELWDGETGRELLHVRKTAPEFCRPGGASEHQIFSGDIDEAGRWIVTGGSFNFGYDNTAMRSSPVVKGTLADVWDARSGRLVHTFSLSDRQHVSWAAISRNGERVASLDNSLNAKLWDRETGRELASVEGALPPGCEPIFLRQFNDDLTRFAALVKRQNDGQGRRFIYLCDLASRRTWIIDPPPGEQTWYRKLTMKGDGRELIASLEGGTGDELGIFDFETRRLRALLHQPTDKHVSSMSYGSDGSTIVLGFTDGHLHLVDLRNKARVELRVSDGPIQAAAYLADRGIVRVVAERKWITNEAHPTGYHRGPMRIADFAVHFPSPSP